MRKAINTATLRKVLFFLFLFFGYYSIAQENLIPNGSFEKFRSRSPFISNAIPWKGINTVDYYKQPLPGDTSEFKGARTGIAFGGLRFQKNYKEFIYVKFTSPLKKNVTYHFEMHVRLAHWSTNKLKSLGAYFSKAMYNVNDEVNETNSIDTIAKKGLVADNDGWIKISGDYTAKGGEKIITIGNFKKKIKKEMVAFRPLKFEFKEAYYYFDDISLTAPFKEIKKDTIIAAKADTVPVVEAAKDTLAIKDFKEGDVIQLENIYFETDKSNLLPESFTELDKLAETLKNHPTMEVQINGHTDNKGSEERNNKLSNDRAKAVYDYLRSIPVPNKITYKGFGATKPIANNASEQGRQKNRRVEFQIIKQFGTQEEIIDDKKR